MYKIVNTNKEIKSIFSYFRKNTGTRHYGHSKERTTQMDMDEHDDSGWFSRKMESVAKLIENILIVENITKSY